MKTCSHFKLPGIGEFWFERDQYSIAHQMHQVIQEDGGQLTIYAGDMVILFTPEEWSAKNGPQKE